jgi:hypothetical protein
MLFSVIMIYNGFLVLMLTVDDCKGSSPDISKSLASSSLSSENGGPAEPPCGSGDYSTSTLYVILFSSMLGASLMGSLLTWVYITTCSGFKSATKTIHYSDHVVNSDNGQASESLLQSEFAYFQI